MNGLGLGLGVLLAGKLLIRSIRGAEFPLATVRGAWVARLAAALTVLTLLWCLTSGLNPRGRYNPETGRLVFSERCLSWLPHSYDAPSTWGFFWRLLALAGVFWAARDWMLDRRGGAGMGSEWARPNNPGEGCSVASNRSHMLLWVLGLNGGLLAVVGILQRLGGSPALFGLIPQPPPEPPADIVFGPFGYRGNAAQYLNLIWPVCLGFAMHLHQHRVNAGAVKSGISPVGLLVVAGLIMAGGTIRMGTRAGGVVAISLLLAATVYAVFWMGRLHGARLGLVVAIPVVGSVLVLGLSSGSLTLQRLLRPAYAYATGLDRPLSEYALRCVFTVPPTNLVRTVGLVGIGPEDSFAYSAGSALFSLTGSRKLALGVRNRAGDQFGLARHIPLAGRAGEVVDLVMTCREGECQVYLDGQPTTGAQALEATARPKSEQAPSVRTVKPQPPQAQAADFLWAGSLAHIRGPGPQWVMRAEIYNRALTSAEVGELNRSPGRSEPDDPGLPPVLAVTGDDLRRPAFSNFYSSGRVEINRVSHRMLKAHGAMGSGPGTYGALYPLYAPGAVNRSFIAAHNDWMEFRITFGMPGFILLLGLLACIPLAVLASGLANLLQPLSFLGGLALLGCLVHARVDYPFQVYSVVQLFVVLACLAFVLGGQRRTATAVPNAVLSA